MLLGFSIVFLTVGLAVTIGLMTSGTINNRIVALEEDMLEISQGDRSGSAGQRLRLYEAGYQLLLEKPLLGYGPGNEHNEIFRKIAENGGDPIAFSHAHNLFLNAGLRSGLLGVVALLAVLFTPLFVAFKARKDDAGWAGFYALSGILVVYLCSGAAGLALGHDIHDTVYLTGFCYGLYLVFGRSPAAAGDPRR